MRLLMWIPTTAMVGGTRSLAWQETRIFAPQWKRAALFSWKRSAQLYLDEILHLPA